MAIFSNVVLITDLDGTLLSHKLVTDSEGNPLSQDKIISDKNLKSIEYFKDNGGIFTIATGRIYQATEQFFDILKPNAPVILNNGGLVYDIEKHEQLYSCYLDNSALSYTLELMEKFPDIGVEINTMDNIYVVRMTEWEKCHLELTHLKYTEKSIEEAAKEPWCKVLFSIESERMHELVEYVVEMGWDKANFVTSGPFLFECLPLNCTKGIALERLSELKKWNEHTVVAAGDYDNDIAMLEFSDIGVAPANAREIVKKSASYITNATCNESAIAEAIEYIEKVCKVK